MMNHSTSGPIAGPALLPISPLQQLASLAADQPQAAAATALDRAIVLRPRQRPQPRVDDRWVNINAGGAGYRTQVATLKKQPSSLSTLVSSGSAWHTSGGRSSIQLDVDGLQFRHALDFLRTGRLEKGLPTSTLSGIRKIATQIKFDGLKKEVKSIYPLREAKRVARGTEGFLRAYLAFTDALYLSGQHEEAQKRWDKVADDYTMEDAVALTDLLNDSACQQRRGLVHLHVAAAALHLMPEGEVGSALRQQKADYIFKHVRYAIDLNPENVAAKLMVQWFDVCPNGLSRDAFRSFVMCQLHEVTVYRPHCVEAWQHLGTQYEELSDWDRALERWRIALDPEPNNLELRYLRTRCLIEKGNYHAANRELVTLRFMDEDNDYTEEVSELTQDMWL